MSVAVSGLVISVSDDEANRAALIEALVEAGCFELGEWIENRLPVALEAADERISREWFEWLCGLPGVVKVDVAVVSWEAEDLQSTSGA